MEITLCSLNDFDFYQFKLGDEKAFEKIFKANYRQILGFCEQFVNDSEQAKGITQEAFIKLWLNRKKIEKVNGIKSFLFTSAKTGCMNLIRHKKVINRYQEKQLYIQENRLNSKVLESYDFNSLEFSELEKVINKTIDELPEKCRMVFIKSRFEEKKNKEIAEEMGITIKSVEANMTRALKIIKIKLSQYLPTILVQFIIQNL